MRRLEWSFFLMVQDWAPSRPVCDPPWVLDPWAVAAGSRRMTDKECQTVWNGTFFTEALADPSPPLGGPPMAATSLASPSSPASCCATSSPSPPPACVWVDTAFVWINGCG